MTVDPLIPGGVVSLSGEAADRLLAAGSGDAALLYLALLRRGGQADLNTANRALKWSGERLAGAYDALVKAGLADKTPPAPSVPVLEGADEPPEYRAEDIAREMGDGESPFPGLVGEVQRRLGKILSTADLKTLYTVYDYLALPAEVICLLVSWCVEEQERKYGPGRKPRMPQIRKAAFAWRRLGLDTAEAVEAYLRRQSALNSREGAVLAMMGVAGRPAVDEESKYISAWVEMGFDDDVIRLAYERTLFKKQNMNWAYMNAILKKWHEKGLHTMGEVLSKDSKWRQAAAAGQPDAGRVNDDIQWMQEFLAREKAGEEGK